jgi:16S rRNA (uracil1498-N3)-methyltransferase
MRLTRCYVPGEWAGGELLPLPGGAEQHLLKVLRLRAGDRVDVFNGAGRRATAELTAAARGAARLRIVSLLDPEPLPELRVTLLQAAARSDRLDWVVQKAVELGAATIRIATTEHSIVKLDARQSLRKLEHWRAVAVSACEQCGRAHLPSIAAPEDLAAAAAAILHDEHPIAFFALDPRGELSLLAKAQTLLTTAGVERRVAVAIGPEGGFSDTELHLLQRCGAQIVRCGPRILRTETAAVTALALLQGALGDLGVRPDGVS